MPHIHKKIDFTVEVFIVYKDKVLLRIHDKYKCWLSVGGHIELDEDPNEAAAREVREEVGLEIELYDTNNEMLPKEHNKFLIPPMYLNRHKINDEHDHITMIYFAKTNSEKLALSENEITENAKWFLIDELDSPEYEIREDVKYCAKKALELLIDK